MNSSEIRARNPGTGAWFVLNLLSVVTPVAVLILMSVAERAVLEQTFKFVVSHSVLLLIAFAIFSGTIGTLVFQRTWPGPWDLIHGIVLGLTLLAAIGVGLSRTVAPQSELSLTEFGYWAAIQGAIVLGVLFYCSALKSWTLRQFDERLDDADEEIARCHRQNELHDEQVRDLQNQLESSKDAWQFGSDALATKVSENGELQRYNAELESDLKETKREVNRLKRANKKVGA